MSCCFLSPHSRVDFRFINTETIFILLIKLELQDIDFIALSKI